MLPSKILAFFAHWSQMKNTETEFRGNRKVAFILSQWRGEQGRPVPWELCPLPWGVWKWKWSHSVAQSCLTLCDPMEGNLPDSAVQGIFQARKLEWIAISFSRGSSQARDRTRVSCIADRHFTIWAMRGLGVHMRQGLAVRSWWWETKVTGSWFLPLALFQWQS